MKQKLDASFALVAEAIAEVVRKRATLIGAAFLPIISIFAINIIAAEMAPSMAVQLFLAFLTFPLYAVFAIVVHRVVLLGEHSLPNPRGVFWTEREWRFLGWLIGIWFLYFALSLPIGIINAVFSQALPNGNLNWFATILGYLLIAYFEGRFSLVLPATAIDRRSDFKESWAMSRGKGMMIAVALVIPAMILIPVELVLYNSLEESLWPRADLIWMLLALPVLAVQIAIISIAYSKLASQGGR